MEDPPSSPFDSFPRSESLLAFELDSPTRESYLREFGSPGNIISTAAVERDPDNEPPHSRVFIICGKSVREETLTNLFRACGEIEYCRLIRDKVTNESKGVGYIKFTKASAAAVAIENLNGKQVQDEPLKVMIADAKGSRNSSKIASKEPEDTPPRSRLFIICSKEISEEELTAKFKAFGDLEYCKLMKDRQTGESKGCGYAKFSKGSTAAIAMETINQQNISTGIKLRALIANPKAKRSTSEHVKSQELNFTMQFPYAFPFAYPGFGINYQDYGQYPYPQYFATYPRQRLFIVVHKSVSQEQLSRMFARFPGMEYCDLKKDKKTGESKGFAYINYSTPQAASLAKQQLDGIEFPPGHVLKVIFAEPLGAKNSQVGPMVADPLSFSAMRDSFVQMISYPFPPYSPPPMDTSDKNIDPPGSRLFVVMMNKNLPEYVLYNMFSQVAGLQYIKIQKDKNYGYVKYSTAAAAQYAINYFDGMDVNTTKLKVQVAQPPQDSRKRQKT